MNALDAAFAKAVTTPSVPASSAEFVQARKRFMSSDAFLAWLVEVAPNVEILKDYFEDLDDDLD
jgi:hypothetical protein